MASNNTAGSQSLVGTVVHAQHQQWQIGLQRLDADNQIDPADAGHVQVHQQQVKGILTQQVHDPKAVARLGGDLHIRCQGKNLAQATAHNGMVVGQ